MPKVISSNETYRESTDIIIEEMMKGKTAQALQHALENDEEVIIISRPVQTITEINGKIVRSNGLYTSPHLSIREWLHTCPCVKDGRVQVDVRGVYPIAIMGMRTCVIECKNDFVFFIIEVL